MENLFSKNIEAVEREINKALSKAQDTKVELLKHYLLNLILYLNLSEDEQNDSPIKEKLTTISILLDKLRQMEDKTNSISLKRVVDKKMMKNKGESDKSKNRLPPQEKYRKNAEKQKERTKKEDDFNINTKKSKKNNFN